MIKLISLALCFNLLQSPRAFADMSDFQAAPARGATEDYARGDLEFRLASSDLRAYSLNDFQQFKFVLLVATDTGQCTNVPILDAVDALLERLPKQLREKTKVLVVDAALAANRPAIANQIASRWKSEKLSNPVYLFDPLQLISASLLFKSAGDYAIVDPKTTSILATGNYSDLNSGLAENYLNGRVARQAAIEEPLEIGATVSLCNLKFGNNSASTSFVDEFAKPFQRACLRCHSRSEPFNIFPTLDDVVGWRAMSLRTIRTMRMPGQHVGHYSPVLPYEASSEDLRKVVRWLDQTTAIKDEWREVYAATLQESKKKQLKTLGDFRADVTLEAPTNLSIPSTGAARYYHLPIGQPAEKEFAIHAVRFSTNLNSVHHANLFVFDPKTHSPKLWRSAVSGEMRSNENILFETEPKSTLRNSTSIVLGRIDQKPHRFIKHLEPIVVTYSRRDGVIRFRPDTALIVPRGHQLGVQLHIEPSGRKEIVPTKFELELMPEGQKFRPISRFKIRPRESFRIPANQARFISEGSFKTERSMSLLSTWFHAHYRAVAYRIWFVTPLGVSMDLLNIPFFQLKMEQSREYWPRGMFIPKGSEIYFRIEYDNSKMNNANPDPDASVKLGGSVYQSEMHYPRFVFVEED